MISCRANDLGYQLLPVSGPLKDRLDWGLLRLKKELERHGEDEVYAYVLTSARHEEGKGMVQEGSGPNFEGGRITLCTCKHRMRAYRSPEDWTGVWIAGFTSRTVSNHPRLFYLMKIDRAFWSHEELWRSEYLGKRTLRAKSSRHNKRGDLYEPKDGELNAFKHESYLQPIEDHSHRQQNYRDQWHLDVEAVAKKGKLRRAALLVGEPELSFVWPKTSVILRSKLGRGEKRFVLGELLELLSELAEKSSRP